MSYAPGLDNITAADIARAAENPDMYEALAPLAIISQVESGDVAAQVFSNMDEGEWRAASVAEREAKIREWISVERMYARAEDAEQVREEQDDKIIRRTNWDDPAARLALIESVGVDKYNRLLAVHHKRHTVATRSTATASVPSARASASFAWSRAPTTPSPRRAKPKPTRGAMTYPENGFRFISKAASEQDEEKQVERMQQALRLTDEEWRYIISVAANEYNCNENETALSVLKKISGVSTNGSPQGAHGRDPFLRRLPRGAREKRIRPGRQAADASRFRHRTHGQQHLPLAQGPCRRPFPVPVRR